MPSCLQQEPKSAQRLGSEWCAGGYGSAAVIQVVGRRPAGWITAAGAPRSAAARRPSAAPAGRKRISEFFPVEERENAGALILDHARTTDVYVGCAPRKRRSGTKDAVGHVWTLWAECDGEDSVEALRRFERDRGFGAPDVLRNAPAVDDERSSGGGVRRPTAASAMIRF